MLQNLMQENFLPVQRSDFASFCSSHFYTRKYSGEQDSTMSDGVRKSKELYFLQRFISLFSIFLEDSVGLALSAIQVDHFELFYKMAIIAVIKLLPFPLSPHRFQGRSINPKPRRKLKKKIYHES